MRRPAPGSRLPPRTGALLVAIALVIAACGGGSASTRGTAKQARTTRSSSSGGGMSEVQIGNTAWYGGKHHGGPTASGERFNKHAMTAAHRRLPFGTRVRVTHRKTGKSVVVRINDRGPFGGRAIIDVSEAAARQLGIIREGIAPVRIEVIEWGARKR